MATTAEFIGVYIADIITTATITIIVATIITITAIGETYRVVAVPQGKGRSTRCGLFSFSGACRQRSVLRALTRKNSRRRQKVANTQSLTRYAIRATTNIESIEIKYARRNTIRVIGCRPVQ
jgi:hypothetical protein